MRGRSARQGRRWVLCALLGALVGCAGTPAITHRRSGSSTTLALIFPTGAIPSDNRQYMLGGFETNTQTDYTSYHAFVDTSGNLNIRPIAKYNFVWPELSNQQTVFLDGLGFAI